MILFLFAFCKYLIVMDLQAVIRERRSVRTFVDKPLSSTDFSELDNMCLTVQCPFGGKARLFLRRFETKGAQRPGTYGTISGCSSYFIVASAGDTLSVLNAGFRMENIVLRATDSGLGTCWLGGTFRRSDFDVVDLPAGMEIIAIVAVGYPAGRKRLLERFTGMMAHSGSRKPFDSMFFDSEWSRPMAEDSVFGRALALMRLAPSSLNSQPWRALASGNEISFYSSDGSRMHFLDCGIGLQHFAAGMCLQGIKGRFEVMNPDSGDGRFRYLISFIREN